MSTYNIHPLLVHFPIALLFLYSIIKIVPLKKWLPNVALKHIERALLVFGVLGAFAALATGDTAEHLSTASRPLIEMHANFAGFATFVYGALLAGEIAAMIRAEYSLKIKSPIFLKFCSWVERIFCEKTFSKILALVGFIAIIVTGLLGGVIVYGTTADPLAGAVLKILGL